MPEREIENVDLFIVGGGIGGSVAARFAAGINYYIDGNADLDPRTMYPFWNLDFSDAMFAWIYTKTLDDGKDYSLSGRLAVKAILRADRQGTGALDEYETLARRITRQTRRNQSRAIGRFETNRELQRHLRRNTLRTAVLMGFHMLLNRFRSPEKLELLPP